MSDLSTKIYEYCKTHKPKNNGIFRVRIDNKTMLSISIAPLTLEMLERPKLREFYGFNTIEDTLIDLKENGKIVSSTMIYSWEHTDTTLLEMFHFLKIAKTSEWLENKKGALRLAPNTQTVVYE
jgi:hypothetical protein